MDMSKIDAKTKEMAESIANVKQAGTKPLCSYDNIKEMGKLGHKDVS